MWSLLKKDRVLWLVVVALLSVAVAARASLALALLIVLGLAAFAYQRGVESTKKEKRELDAAIDRERRLNELALAVSSTTQLPEILAGVVSIAVDLVQADAGCVALVSASGEPTLVHQRGLASGSLSWLARSPGVASEVLRPCRALKIDDYPRHALANAEIVAQGFSGLLGVPLVSAGAALGVLTLFVRARDRPFSARDLASVEAAARHAAVAIRNAQLVEALEKELSERERLESAGEALIRELSAKNEELERFAYAVSHDLKSPLITVRGFLGFLERDVLAGDTERVRDDLVRIQEATRRMQRLVDELLELSRIGRRVNPPETLPFDEIAREAAGLVEGRLRMRGVSVEIPPDLPYVHGDRPRLVGVVQNLLDNAAKFMGDEPRPRVEVGARTGEGTEPVFFVRDNGIGIEAPFREKVFSLFEKLDPDSEGTGVGLALVRRIIEVHGGRIWIESPGRGRGTTFAFTLPFVHPDPGVGTGRGRRP